MSLSYRSRATLVVASLAVCAASANAATISSGLYRLHNHPDGNQVPPPYGARFDELYNATGGHDVFTLDFDHASSGMYMNVDLANAKILIYGTAFGGRDTGGSYAADGYLGLYTISFLYDIGVQAVPGDDDVWTSLASPGHVNFGSITTPLSDVIQLTDETDAGFSIRIGDEDNDLGHRGYPGISGWGWMSYVTPGGIVHVNDTDWIFTAELVPAPSALGLFGVGVLGLARRRR